MQCAGDGGVEHRNTGLLGRLGKALVVGEHGIGANAQGGCKMQCIKAAQLGIGNVACKSKVRASMCDDIELIQHTGDRVFWYRTSLSDPPEFGFKKLTRDHSVSVSNPVNKVRTNLGRLILGFHQGHST